MSKAICLIRVSTSRQELDSQTQAVMNEALRAGFKEKDLVIIEDIESAIKLSEEERNGLNRMKDEIAKDSSITHVFIYELSRLSRRQLVLFSIRDYLIERNIQLVCCTPYFRLLEEGKLSQTANLMFSIFASMAESEMSLKQERMKRGRERNKLTGKNSSGVVLYGYKTLEDKTIVIDEYKKGFVVDLFEMYSTGLYSESDIAEELYNKYGTVKDTVAKLRSKISHMIKQRRYCGDSQYPQIITEELFDKVVEMRKKNKLNNKRQIKDESLLKKIIFDKESGYHMTYSSNGGSPRYALKCRYNGPIITTVRLKDIDDKVWNLAVILHKTYVSDSKKIKNELEKRRDNLVSKIENLNINDNEILAKIDKVEERLILGAITEQKANEIEKRLKDDKAKIKKSISDLVEELKTVESMLNVGESEVDYESFSREEKIKTIRQMIKRIEIWKKSRYEPVADVYTKVDNFLYQIHMNSWNGSSYLTSKALLD